MGNEPDLFKTSAQGIMRPGSWSETDYVKEWNTKIESIKGALSKNCGAEWVSKQRFQWLAPSFAGTGNSLNPLRTWNAQLNKSGVIGKFSSHKYALFNQWSYIKMLTPRSYIGGATQPGVTLGGTLMNHTRTASSISSHVSSRNALRAAGLTLPYILGETNSLYNQGAPDLSNSFGAALWGLDFNLLCAANSISQVFMHQGTNFRYASWQPKSTNKTTKGTKAPYYGNIAVAAALGDLSKGSVRVANVPMQNEKYAGYAIFGDQVLKRMVLVNLNQYNYTDVATKQRGNPSWKITVPKACAGTGTVQRLMANGSNAITGISFNGMSYNYELDEGRPKVLSNATRDEVVKVGDDGGLSVNVPDSSAAVVQLVC